MFKIYAKQNDKDFGLIDYFKTELGATSAVLKFEEYDKQYPEYQDTIYTIVEENTNDTK
jgi:hypothetical protein